MQSPFLWSRLSRDGAKLVMGQSLKAVCVPGSVRLCLCVSVRMPVRFCVPVHLCVHVFCVCVHLCTCEC